jgi:hypothetical protein
VAFDEPVVPYGPAAGHEVDLVDPVAVAAQRLQQPGDLPGVVLPIGVHEHDALAPRPRQPGAQRGRLAGVPAQPDVGDLGHAVLGHQPGRAVGAAIVDDDDLERQTRVGQDRHCLWYQLREVRPFVVSGENHRDLGPHAANTQPRWGTAVN